MMHMKYTLKRSKRKTVKITVRNGKVEVFAPLHTSLIDVERTVHLHESWISETVKKQTERAKADPNFKRLPPAQIEQLVIDAKETIPPRVAIWASVVGVTYGRITVRKQKTKWGSCSSKKNLNFNCLLMLMPSEVRDAVIVHELCHLKHPNHSKDFYDEVRRVIPDYDRHDAWLKKNGLALMKQLHG